MPTLPTASGPAAADCPNYEGGVCLGKLDAGTYTTTAFQPKLAYTVPAGWTNYEDVIGNFLLVPKRGTLKGVNADTGDFIGVYRTVLAASPKCNDEPAPGIGRRPSDIANWWHREPGLVTTAPKPVTIDGLSGLVTDVHLTPTWTHDCKYSHAKPTVPLTMGVELSALDHGTGPGRTTRFYLLGFRGGTLAIEVPDFSMGKHLAEYDRVVKTFRFGK